MTSPNVIEIVVKSTDKTGPAFEAAKRGANGLADSLKRVGEVAAGVLVADAVQGMAQRAAQFIKGAVQAASSLGESVNAVQKTFGSASAEIEAFGKTSAQNVGLSSRAFNQLAVPLGAMLKNAGLSMAEVTDQTIKLTKRASDMGSVFDTDVASVLTAIQAGLRGEMDPLERFGVSLSAAAVDARALADSGKESTKELTNQEKALARLNIIYDQTASTAGDFKDTADSLANTQRRTTAAFEQSQAKIGATFIPIFQKATEVAGGLAEGFGDMAPVAQVATAAVVGLGAATALMAPKVIAAKDALDSMAASDSALQRGMSRTAKVVAAAGAAFAVFEVAALAVDALLGDKVAPDIEATADGLQRWAKEGKLAGEAARVFGDDIERLRHALSAGAAGGIAQDVEAIAALDAALTQMVSNGNGEAAAETLRKIGEGTYYTVDQLKTLLPGYAAAMETSTGKTKELGAAAEEASPSVDELKTSIDGIIDQAFSLEEAEDRIADAVVDLNEQIKEQKKRHEDGAGSLDRHTQAGRDNAAKVRDMVEAYVDLMEKRFDEGKSIEGLRGQLIKQLTDLGLSETAAERYAQSLVDVKKALDAIKSKEVYLNLHIPLGTQLGGAKGYRGFDSGGITGAASGGQRGGWTMVGERGRELVKLPYGSSVIPNGTTENMMGGSSRGSGPVSLEVMPGGSGEFEQFLTKIIRRYVRVTGGGNVQTAFGR